MAALVSLFSHQTRRRLAILVAPSSRSRASFSCSSSYYPRAFATDPTDSSFMVAFSSPVIESKPLQPAARADTAPLSTSFSLHVLNDVLVSLPRSQFLPSSSLFDSSHYTKTRLDWRSASMIAFWMVNFGLVGVISNEQEPCLAEQDSKELLLKPSSFKQSLVDELQAACEVDRVVLDPEERYNHAKSWNSYYKVDTTPDAIVYPKSTEEVVAIVKICERYKVPIIPFGGNTSIEGHLASPRGGVSIDMNLMKGIKELHIKDMDVVVEPGIGWIELNEFLKPFGLFFPLDPGPGASIGGMCATRCSGSLAVRYGTMRDNVISLKVVLASGDVVKTASRARKSAAGYDLTRLIIGSGGTLGVITEVTLRLQKIPEASVVAMCNFPSVKDAADVAIATMHSGIQVSRVELLDEVQIKAINLANGKHYPEQPTLMFELIGTEAYSLEQALQVKKIAEEHHASDFVFADTAKEKEDLWKMRKEALWACTTLRPEAEFMVTDVCVPLSRLAECIYTSKVLLDASPLICTIVSHAGDGNFHTIILLDPQSEEELKEAHRLADEMVKIALAMEGTCTGEHGVGVGKLKFLEEELGQEALMTMGKIKRTLDPNNIMNPGKTVPPEFCY
ncbi:hypothetical protein O6H91_07G030700 [Diphasiastrum complanatum]|uniref:Uncharacterized protein n=1 Tax=Diphasiastrum complanatum TaxID=34168 RepID=A0ACC2D3M8_DIPCM|nr:hypothetical protein O6H91_07G030700 [Diphasiastrum complanatum]